MPSKRPDEYREIMDRLQLHIGDFATVAAKLGLINGKTLADVIDAVKTIAQFGRALRRAVLLFWRGDINEFDFIDRMVSAIDEQYRRAWREGMRANGLDPIMDNQPGWDKVLNQRINKEYDYVLDFGTAILKAREDGQPVDALYARADLWIQRYNEVADLAKITTGGDKKYIWLWGATKEHCKHCEWLQGVVAFGSVWTASGWRPKDSALECGGYRCECGLYETQLPITKKQPTDLR